MPHGKIDAEQKYAAGKPGDAYGKEMLMSETKDISLVVLAAGIGSRFGGVKQLAPVGPDREIIIEYSIHDAIAAGFNKIVFILRRDIFADFKETIGSSMEARFAALGVKWEYVFQELVDPPEGRTKPWGTGQALLACKDVLDGPFAVINADDYYGREAYGKAYDFLAKTEPDAAGAYGMVGFVLKNTLSDNGGVTRGVCSMDEDGFLTKIDETHDIIKTGDGAAAPGGDGALRPMDLEALVSMNLWMLTPDFLDVLEQGFPAFRAAMKNPLKDEYLLPDIVDRLLKEGRATVRVESTNDRWFGVTYQADLPEVREEIGKLYDQGVYGSPLFDDLR